MSEISAQQTEVALGGMTCGHCVDTVEKALLAVEGVRSASADLATQSASVEYDAGAVSLTAMQQAVAAAGYAPNRTSDLVSIGVTAPKPGEAQVPPIHQAPTTTSKLDSLRLEIEGMTCASCVRSVEQAALRAPGVQQCDVSLTEATARVVYDPAQSSAEDLIQAIRNAGYGAALETAGRQGTDAAGASSTLRRRLIVSAALTAPLLVMAMAHGQLGFGDLAWTQLALALPVVMYGGAPFYAGAWTAARHLRCDMNTLVAVGTGTAFGYSVAATVAPSWVSGAGSAPVYFETAAAILTLVLLGRVLETRARRRTSSAIRKLLALQADSVWIRRDGRELEVSQGQVAIGDEVLVRAGERMPVDGTIIEGSGAVDESPLTGESAPVDKRPGSRTLSGSLNKDGFFVVRAESVGSETALARIIEFVRRAQNSKSPATRLADRIAAVFVPAILAVAAVTFAVWMIAGPDQDRVRMAINGAVSVLIIACPCALGLATPAALAVGVGRAAESGILVRDGAALEAARGIDTVVFDKTGTLTLGRFGVTDFQSFEGVEDDELLRSTSAIERLSEHPIAQAIASMRPAADLHVSDYRTLPGTGASGRVEGRQWLLGKPDLFAEQGIDISKAQPALDRFAREGKSAVLAAKGNRLAGLFALRDTIHPEAVSAVAALQQRGIRTMMISGDNAQAAGAIASLAGIDEVLADVLPVEKSAAIKKLQAKGAVVAMVGDGINDAPALAQADLGIAIGAGTDIAVESAGIVLVRNSPADVGRAIDLARRVQRTIAQNYVWAFGYNLLGVPVAAGVLYPWTGMLLSPIVASAAMALSSVSVLANSLRLSLAMTTKR